MSVVGITDFLEKQNEKLARMITTTMATKEDLTGLEERMEKRFDGIDWQLEELRGSLGRRYQELDQLRDRMRQLESRMEKLEVAES